MKSLIYCEKLYEVEIVNSSITGFFDIIINQNNRRIAKPFKDKFLQIIKNLGIKPPFKKFYIDIICDLNIKNLDGIELSITLSLLSQLKKLNLSDSYYYGNIDVKGRVILPRGIISLLNSIDHSISIISAEIPEQIALIIRHGNLFSINRIEDIPLKFALKKADFLTDNFAVNNKISLKNLLTNELFYKIAIALIGRFHTLIIGPSGVGKTHVYNFIKKLNLKLLKNEFEQLNSDLDYIENIEVIYNTPLNFIHSKPSKKTISENIEKVENGIIYIDELHKQNKYLYEVLRYKIDNSMNNSMIISSTNTCNCGFFQVREGKCVCTNKQLINYWKKLEPMLYDRFEIIIGIESIDRLSQDFLSNSNNINYAEVGEILNNLRNRYLYELNKIKLESKAEQALKTIIENNHGNIRLIKSLKKIALVISILNNHKSIQVSDIYDAYKFKIKHPLISGLIK